jgi:hypothetical protein
MDKRLKIISIIFGVVYVIIIGGAIKDSVADFWLGFKNGLEYSLIDKETNTVSPPSSTAGYFFLKLKPSAGLRTFPDIMLNQLDGMPMKAELETIVVGLNNTKELLPKGAIIIDVIVILMAFFSLFIMLFVPVQTFRIVRSITKDKIFNTSNILKLRIIGYALLAYFVVDMIIGYLHYWIAARVIRVEGYVLRMSWENATLVMLGLVVLMFAEVLKVSVRMKEEQDLTV